MRPRLRYLLPWRKRLQEREMQEEFAALQELAGPGKLGNLTLAAENTRAMWHWTAFDGVAADFRYAVRTLRRQPGFVAVAVFSLALGIGASGAIFSLADAVLLRPLPVERPGEVVSLSNSTPENPVEPVSYPDYLDLRALQSSFSGLVAYRTASMGVGTSQAIPPMMRLTAMVSDNFFSALGIAPALGRVFSRDEGLVPGRDAVVVLGYDFWRSQYGADSSVIGRRLRVNGVEFTIAGVLPEQFTGLELLYRPDVYVPLSMWERLASNREDPLHNRGRRELTLKGRLRPGVSLAAARAEMAILGRNLERAYPETNRNRGVAVRSELDARIRQAPMRLVMVAMLLLFVGLVLVIACANVANLLLARAHARGREIAIRVAIGAGRLRLARQTLTESLLLAVAGGLAGLGVAHAGMRFLATLQISSDIPLVLDLKLDARVLAFSLALAVASCLLFGLAPALQIKPSLRYRKILSVAQIALSVVLLTVAGMFLEGLHLILAGSPGFRTDHLIGMSLDPAVLRYSALETHDFYRHLLNRVRVLPGVKSVALAEALPYSPNQTSVTVVPEGYQFPHGLEKTTVFGGAIDENYCPSLHMRTLQGRGFTSGDRDHARPVALVNEQFARMYWPGQNAVGKRLRLEGRPLPLEVVGVVQTARYLYPTEPPRPYVYLPYEQNPCSRMTLIAESYGDPAALAPGLRDSVRALDPDLPVFDLRTLVSHEARAVNNWLVFLEMFVIMAAIGLILAMVGLYGLISYSVARRTQEIGVRMAIGASPGDAMRLILRQGMGLALTGITIGGIVGAAAAPALARGFVGPGTNHLAIHVLVPAAILAACLLASFMPARRAARLDPVRALRCE